MLCSPSPIPLSVPLLLRKNRFTSSALSTFVTPSKLLVLPTTRILPRSSATSCANTLPSMVKVVFCEYNSRSLLDLPGELHRQPSVFPFSASSKAFSVASRPIYCTQKKRLLSEPFCS
ncbi:MAG: hypothetical protein [Inoviridae sp.]|nr:MAG: hypothetical protein [Inoviridae sp.]